MKKNMNPLRPYERIDTLKQFLDHDPKILRFYCYWDDTESMFGDPRELILHYFLADDTIEIYENHNPNSGRDTVPKFLHRGRLPKVSKSILTYYTKYKQVFLSFFFVREYFLYFSYQLGK